MFVLKVEVHFENSCMLKDLISFRSSEIFERNNEVLSRIDVIIESNFSETIYNKHNSIFGNSMLYSMKVFIVSL